MKRRNSYPDSTRVKLFQYFCMIQSFRDAENMTKLFELVWRRDLNSLNSYFVSKNSLAGMSCTFRDQRSVRGSCFFILKGVRWVIFLGNKGDLTFFEFKIAFGENNDLMMTFCKYEKFAKLFGYFVSWVLAYFIKNIFKLTIIPNGFNKESKNSQNNDYYVQKIKNNCVMNCKNVVIIIIIAVYIRPTA